MDSALVIVNIGYNSVLDYYHPADKLSGQKQSGNASSMDGPACQ
jgi:hypothetical protein